MIIAIGDHIIIKSHNVLIKSTTMTVAEIKTQISGTLEEETIYLECIEKDSVVFHSYNKAKLENMLLDKENFEHIKRPNN